MAALKAVTDASPFERPLPPGAGQILILEFTFDCNVFQNQRFKNINSLILLFIS